MGHTWRRLLGSVAFALVATLVLFWREIFSGQLDLPGLLVGVVAGSIVSYRAWPALAYTRWARWTGK